MERLRERLYEGMAERGITGEIADEIFVKMAAFANYGFPESHSVSFAYLVYASSWIKYHEPAAFCAALLNAQPMGFWSPHSLVQDARRHGVVVRTPDLNASLALATLEPCPSSHRWRRRPAGDRFGARDRRRSRRGDRGRSRRTHRSRTLVRARAGAEPGAARGDGHRRRCSASASGCERREALWAVGAAVAVAARSPGRAWSPAPSRHACPAWTRWRWPSPTCGPPASRPTGHPTQFLRDQLDELGVVTSPGLWDVEPRSQVLVAGVVTHRQRPMTAQGTTFLNLEDETGLINVVVSKGCWARYRAGRPRAPRRC